MNITHLSSLYKLTNEKQQFNYISNIFKNEIISYCSTHTFDGELRASLDENDDLNIYIPSFWQHFKSSQKFILTNTNTIYLRLNFHKEDEFVLGIDFHQNGKVEIANAIIDLQLNKITSLQRPKIIFDYDDNNLTPYFVESLFKSFSY